jgi:hypothetical protein
MRSDSVHIPVRESRRQISFSKSILLHEGKGSIIQQNQSNVIYGNIMNTNKMGNKYMQTPNMKN